MLTITSTASDAIRQLVEGAGACDTAGVRITAGEPTDEGTPLRVELVDGPEPGDEVVTGNEASVFVEEQVSPYLDETVLDARVHDGEVEFALRDQGMPPPTTNGNGPH